MPETVRRLERGSDVTRFQCTSPPSKLYLSTTAREELQEGGDHPSDQPAGETHPDPRHTAGSPSLAATIREPGPPQRSAQVSALSRYSRPNDSQVYNQPGL